ncbi:unnamed protein product [Heterosigma akashiwo]
MPRSRRSCCCLCLFAVIFLLLPAGNADSGLDSKAADLKSSYIDTVLQTKRNQMDFAGELSKCFTAGEECSSHNECCSASCGDFEGTGLTVCSLLDESGAVTDQEQRDRENEIERREREAEANAVREYLKGTKTGTSFLEVSGGDEGSQSISSRPRSWYTSPLFLSLAFVVSSFAAVIAITNSSHQTEYEQLNAAGFISL